MSLLLDPSIFFITPKLWNDKINREIYLDFLNSFLDLIDQTKLSIYWNYELMEYIQNNLYSPPWINDRKWNNQIFPIFFKKFVNCKKEFIEESTKCEISPELNSIDSKIITLFLQIAHFLIHNNNLNSKIPIYFSNFQSKVQYILFCNCNRIEKILNSKSFYEILEFVKFLEEENYLYLTLWPKNRNDFENFNILISILEPFYFPDHTIKYQYDFLNSFIHDLSHENLNLKEITKSIISRICLDNSQFKYHNEKIEANLFRYRPTHNTRIHYKYKENIIQFVNYYPPGEHDKGLRK